MARIILISILTTVFILSRVAKTINGLQPTKDCTENDVIGTTDCKPNNVNISRWCNCDDQCHVYGDCCPSKIVKEKHLNVTESTSKPKWECHDLHSVYVSQVSGELIEELIQIYMIGTCPITWKDPYTTNLCERRHISQRRYTFVIDMPTVSKSTNKTYVNRYCAFCNSDSKNLDKWDLLVICPDEDPNCSTKSLKYIPRKWEFTRQARNNQSNVRLVLRTFTEFQEYEHKYKARTCHKNTVIDKCRKTTNKYKKRTSTDLVTHIPKDDCRRCFASNTCDHVSKTCQIYSCDSGIRKVFNGFCVSLPKSKLTLVQHALPDQSGYYNRNESNFRLLSLKTSCKKNLIIVALHQIVILGKNTIHIKEADLTFENVEYEIVNTSLVLLCLDLEVTMPKLHWTLTVTQSTIASVCFAVSQTCLLLHIIVSILLNKLSTLPQKNLFCLSLSLLIAQLSFAFGLHHETHIMISCLALSLTSHFGFLASFFWLNVLAFDVFLSFVGNATSTSSNIGTKREFLRYSIYAWSLPLFIVSLALSFNISGIIPSIDPYCTMQYQQTCFINNPIALQIFFLAPFVIVVFENVIFLSIVKRIIYNKFQKTGKKTTKNDVQADCISRFSNYAKLTLLMVLTWTFGTVAAMLNIQVLIYPFIVANALQGVFIFIVFVSESDVYILLSRKFRTPTKELHVQRMERDKQVMQTVGLRNAVSQAY